MYEEESDFSTPFAPDIDLESTTEFQVSLEPTTEPPTTTETTTTATTTTVITTTNAATDNTINVTTESVDSEGIPPAAIRENIEYEDEVEAEEELEYENENNGSLNSRNGSIAGDYFVNCKTNLMCLNIRKTFVESKKIKEEEYSEFFLQNGAAFDDNGMTCGFTSIQSDPTVDPADYLTFCSFPDDTENIWSCGTTIDVKNEF